MLDVCTLWQQTSEQWFPCPSAQQGVALKKNGQTALLKLLC